MIPVALQCPLCSGMIQVDPAWAGQQVACPRCQGIVTIPPREMLVGPPPELPPPTFAPQVFSPPEFSPPEFSPPVFSPPSFAPSTFSPPPFSPPGFSPPTFPPPTFSPNFGPPELPDFQGGQRFSPPVETAPAELIQLGCPICGGPFQVSPQMAGQQVGCPHCASPVTVPMLGGEIPMGVAMPIEAPPPLESPPEFPPQFVKREENRFPPPARPKERKPVPVVPPENPAAPPRDLYPPGFVPPSAPPAELSPASAEPAPPPRERKAAKKHRPDHPPADRYEMRPEPAPPPRSQPNIDDLLPPGAAAAPVKERTIDWPESAASPPPIDQLLPPGADGLNTPPPSAPAVQPSLVDTLLPPGGIPAEGGAGADVQVPLPQAPLRRPIPLPDLPAGAIAIPTPDGGFVTVREEKKTISVDGAEIELKKLTPEVKAWRRFVRNSILYTICVLILFGAIYFMIRH